MINNISNFDLDLFDIHQSSSPGTSPKAPAEDFAALLLGIPVPTVPVNTPDQQAETIDPAAAAPDLAGSTPKGPVAGQAPVKLPPQEAPAIDDKSPGKDVKTDLDLAVLQEVRPITDPIRPVKLPPLPGDTTSDNNTKGSLDLSILKRHRQYMGSGPIVKLPPEQNGEDVKTGVKDPSTPVLPTRLPPEGSLWGNDNPRDPDKKKGFGLQVQETRRPIIDAQPTETSNLRRGPWAPLSTGTAPATAPAPVADPAQDGEAPAIALPQETTPPEIKFVTDASYEADTHATARPAEKSTPAFEQIDPEAQGEVFIGRVDTTSEPAMSIETASQVQAEMPVNDVNPARPLKISAFLPPDELETNQTEMDTAPPIVPAAGETPLLRPQLTYQDPDIKADKPLLRTPFQQGSANLSSTEKNDVPASLGQIVRNVSFAFDPNQGTEPPRVSYPGVRNATTGEPGSVPLEINESFAGAETAKKESENSSKKPETIETGEILTAALGKLAGGEVTSAKNAGAEITAETVKQAKEILDQVRPGLLQLAALAVRKQEKQSIEMRLHPAELGTVEVSLERNSAGAITAHFKTGTETAKHVLTNNLDHLRESLQSAGWQVGQLQVSSGSTPFTSGQQQGESNPHFEAANNQSFDQRSEQQADPDQNTDRLLNLRA